MIGAAMLAALIVGIAIWPSRFYREDLRIPMETAGPCGRDAVAACRHANAGSR